MYRQEKSLLFFIAMLVVFTFGGCSEYLLNPDIQENELVGTWNLTAILASYPSGKKTLSPGEENLMMVITLNKDRTYSRTQNNRGEITSDAGKWSVESAILTLASGEGTYAFPCRIEGNTLQTSTTIINPDTGNILPVTLEFTKE